MIASTLKNILKEKKGGLVMTSFNGSVSCPSSARQGHLTRCYGDQMKQCMSNEWAFTVIEMHVCLMGLTGDLNYHN